MLDLPTIEEPPVAALAQVPKPDIDLAKVSLRDVALAQFGLWREEADGVVKQLTGLVLDLSTPTKLADAKSLRQRLINVPLAEARKVSKAIKSKLTAVSADVGGELVLIEAAYTSADALITPLIEAADKKLADEKAERDRIEAERVAAIQASIDKIRACVAKCQAPDMTSTRIGAGIAQVEAIAITKEVFFELVDEAAQAKSSTLAAMLNLRDSAKAREDQEALRLENERKAAELKAEQEKQEAAAARLQMAMSQIQGIQQQVAIATLGRLGVRVGGTIECIRETLAETLAWVIDEEHFGILQGSAQAAKDIAVLQIRELLRVAEEKAAEEAAKPAPVQVVQEQQQTAGDAGATAATSSTTNAHSGSLPETSGPCASSEAEPAQASPSGSGMAVQAEESTTRSVAPADNVRAFHPAAAALRGDAPTIQIGYINELIAPVLKTSAEGVIGLGFDRQQRPGSGVHFLASDLDSILVKFIGHLEAVRAEVAEAA